MKMKEWDELQKQKKEYEELQKKLKIKEEKSLKEYDKCEACNKFYVQWILTKPQNKDTYKVCSNCLIDLVGNRLSKEQFFNLLKNGHNKSEFLLCGDFYDNDGSYWQPSF